MNTKLSVVLIFCVLLTSGCATTRVNNAIYDRPGYYPDNFLSIKNAYKEGENLIVCVDAVRHYRTIGNKWIKKQEEYAFSVYISQLERFSRKQSGIIIPLEHISRCQTENELINPEKIPIKQIFKHKVWRAVQSETSGGVLYEVSIRYHDKNKTILYLTSDRKIISLQTEPPITKGRKGLIIVLPFAFAFDVVTFPAQLLIGAWQIMQAMGS